MTFSTRWYHNIEDNTYTLESKAQFHERSGDGLLIESKKALANEHISTAKALALGALAHYTLAEQPMGKHLAKQILNHIAEPYSLRDPLKLAEQQATQRPEELQQNTYKEVSPQDLYEIIQT